MDQREGEQSERGADDIVALERVNRFKRRLMLIAHLSGCAIDFDREIPRD
ncbi:MAG: hypothetical protein QM323_00530 [Acidobacteriota bacterium]|nr:hypothetical protein [Acidobacteriota bacterium]